MTIIRVVHNKENPYVLVNRFALLDKNLSLEAVGLWARLLANKDDWQIKIVDLCKRWGVGKGKIQALFRLLIKFGYARRWRTTFSNGRFGDWVTVLFESPMTDDEIQKMFPELGFPGLVNAPLISTTLKEEEIANALTKKTTKKKQEGLEPPTPEEKLLLEKRFQAQIKRRPLARYPIPFPDEWKLADLKRLRAEKVKKVEALSAMESKERMRLYNHMKAAHVLTDYTNGPDLWWPKKMALIGGCLSYTAKCGGTVMIPDDLPDKEWDQVINSLKKQK